jgi:hypothetical protein
MSKDIIKIDENLLESIQKTIEDCLPIASKAAQTIGDSVTIANGMNQLREFFKNPDVVKLVDSMKDSKLGFLTDKPKGAKKWDPRQQKKVDVVPYTPHEISEALIPMMLEGYRFTGNEINIISGQGMAVKAGKHRKIIEYEGLDGFSHTVGSPVKEGGESGVAKMKCQAKWILDGTEYSIGYGDDICIIAVEYDKWAGLDKLIGLAESKLYSRVLTRILGKFVSEGEISTVITPGDKPESSGDSIKDRFKKQQADDAGQLSKPENKAVKRLAQMLADPQYKAAIQSLLSSSDNQITEADLTTANEGNAEEVIKSIIQTQGFLSAENSEENEDYF